MENNEKSTLNKLFGSTARVKILKFFLSRPGEQYYIRQITRELGLQLNSVRRELENLEGFGILKTSSVLKSQEIEDESYEVNKETLDEDEQEKKKIIKKTSVSKTDKKYYEVNKDFILYEEIKSLFVKAQVLYEKDFTQKVLEYGRPNLMILTGIFTGQENASTDMLIVGHLKKDQLTKMIKELESEMGREINYTVMDKKEYKYRRDITDVFLYEILEKDNIIVVDDLNSV